MTHLNCIIMMMHYAALGVACGMRMIETDLQQELLACFQKKIEPAYAFCMCTWQWPTAVHEDKRHNTPEPGALPRLHT